MDVMEVIQEISEALPSVWQDIGRMNELSTDQRRIFEKPLVWEAATSCMNESNNEEKFVVQSSSRRLKQLSEL